MRSNVIKTDSGLQIQEIVEGSGTSPKAGDRVLINYILHLGTGVSSSNYDYDKLCYIDDQIDSTYEPPFNAPIEIVIGTETKKDGLYSKGDSIAGINEALLGMRFGGKSRLLIPSELAYGVEGGSSFHTFHGYRTPPNRDLDMVIELVAPVVHEGENNE